MTENIKHKGHIHEHTKHTEHKVHSHVHRPEHKHKKIKKIHIWQAVSAILGLLLIFSIFTGGFKGGGGYNTKGVLSADEAADKAVSFINENVLREGQTAKLNSVEDTGQLYKIDFTIGNQEFPSYVTKDGKLLFPNTAIDMEQEIEMPEQPEPAAPDVLKSDKPQVELFVMSHCPFGTQAEKGIIPAVKALGDKIDFKVRFVYYAMHPSQGEVEEQLNQYCIQKEQNDKFLDYLECFLKGGDGETCLTETGIDQKKLSDCVKAADEEFEVTENLEDESKWLNGRFPKFNTDAELNTKYGVRGSPTLVVNGVQSSSGRDSVSYLRSICAAFNDAPEECNVKLSSAQPSSGFGFKETTAGTATSAQCS